MFVMKQKRYLFTLAASMMLAVTGFTSCTIEDNAAGGEGSGEQEELAPVVDDFDEGSEIQNGSCQGALAANYWVHEWRVNDAAESYKGEPNIIADPADRNNRCIAVVVRSNEEAYAGGNATTTDGDALKDDFSNFADWDSQFFITLGADKALKAGDKIRVTMKVKADADQSAGTQSHAAPGDYIHWFCIGDVNFTTDWTDFDSGWIDVVATSTWGKAQSREDKALYSIAFNLAKGAHNTVYFDDIRVEVERYDPFDEGNLVKNGTANKDITDNFLVNDYINPDDAEKRAVQPARIVTDPADESNRCFIVGTNNNASEAWDAQFFITVPEDQAFKVGDKVKLQMKIKADKEQAACGSQCHGAPGSYIFWNCVGDLNFTTEWTDFEKEITVNAQQFNDNGNGPFRTIAFNLAVKGAADGGNNMYFDDIKLTVERAPEIDWAKLADVAINGDFEGTDVSGITWKFKETAEDADHFKFQIQDGIGVEGSRGTLADSFAGEGLDDWSSQFFIVLPKIYAEGTKYQVTFWAKADKDASIDIQRHQEADGNHYIDNCGSLNITTAWAEYQFDGASTTNNNGYLLKSFAFNLNKNKEVANRFYFDNIKIKVVEPE